MYSFENLKRGFMNDDSLLRLLLNSKISDEDALGMIFSNYIDIGGSLIGLTIENCIKAGKLLRKYDERRKTQNGI